MTYLILGNGGRECALAWKLSQSPDVQHIYCMEGNGGTQTIPKCENVASVSSREVPQWARAHGVDCVIPGGEVALMDGVVDACAAAKLRAFGPHKAAALLEGSKSFAKDFMNRFEVRTARHRVFSSADEAAAGLRDFSYPLVIKADGLAAGKGVVICADEGEATNALSDFMVKKTLFQAGETVVVEEFLRGFEASVIAVYDGHVVTPFISAKDHKKIFDGETGPNTGGMGVVAPNPLFTPELHEDFMRHIALPTARGLAECGMHFVGFIFFGLMITGGKNYLLEYNMRLGDPETQALLPLFDGDFSRFLQDALDGRRPEARWQQAHSCCVVLASKDYPGACPTGLPIRGVEEAANAGGLVFAAGARMEKNTLVTRGGRVLGVTGVGASLAAAREAAYGAVSCIQFDGMQYRKDIGVVSDAAG